MTDMEVRRAGVLHLHSLVTLIDHANAGMTSDANRFSIV